MKAVVRNILHILLTIIIAIALAVCLRVFLFASFKIPTPSMTPAIMAGDYILVNKLVPGPRIFKKFFCSDKAENDFWRLNCFKIKRNDVLVFNFPYPNSKKILLNSTTYYAKRCIAISGDTLIVENGIYKVKGAETILGNDEHQKKMSNIADEEFQAEVYQTFPYNNNYDWNIKNFGPLYIPKQGDILKMDTLNIILYKDLIEYETNGEITQQGDSICINNELVEEYTFQKNYYFMAGDWVKDSRDSRYWGLLPEDHIVGKATYIWKSVDMQTDKLRKDRIMKKVK